MFSVDFCLMRTGVRCHGEGVELDGAEDSASPADVRFLISGFYRRFYAVAECELFDVLQNIKSISDVCESRRSGCGDPPNVYIYFRRVVTLKYADDFGCRGVWLRLICQ